MDKPTFGEKFRALLATGRVANLPTVWSNVLIGFWLSSYFILDYNDIPGGLPFRIFLLTIILLIASMIYVGGCMLGDAKDIDFDRENRPNRPLPKGIISVGSVKLAAYSLLVFATFVLFCSTFITVVAVTYLNEDIPFIDHLKLFANKDTLNAIQIHEMILGLLLIAAVVTYAFNHKKNKRAALVMMASCRFLLVMLAIGVAHKTFFAEEFWSAGGPEPLDIYTGWLKSWMIVYAASVGIYTILLSWVASTESKPGPFQERNILAALLFALPLVTFLFSNLINAQILHHNSFWGTNRAWDTVDQTYSLSSVNTIFAGTLALFYFWLIYALRCLQSSKPAFVSCALAGFCLLDACIAATFAPGIALICLGLFVLALILQRVTPAT